MTSPEEHGSEASPAGPGPERPPPFDLEHALRGVMSAPRSPGPEGDEQLREALVHVCREARREGIPVERVLVQFKHLWQEAADAEDGRTHASQERLSRLVSSCIVSYYESR